MSMKLKRKKESLPASPRGSFLDPVLERRSFLKKAGIGLGAGVAATMLPKSLVREAGAAAGCRPFLVSAEAPLGALIPQLIESVTRP